MSIWQRGSMSGLTSVQTLEMEGEPLHALTAMPRSDHHTCWELQSVPFSKILVASGCLESAADPLR